ncbi:MAG: hypothetical protein H7Z41_02565 [Cytophagales bacterium]|nr:hypothetical protein [Armatimonadota bacterium]
MEAEDSTGAWGEPQVSDVLLYRKAAIAVVSSYLGLEDPFVDAVLRDEMDEFLERAEAEREQMKVERYDEYLSTLSRETIVRYAATAAESLALSPEDALSNERAMGDTGILGFTDDVNAVVRVHEIFEFLESPDESEEAETILLTAKRQLCNYYNACAFDLVKNLLLPVIVTAADELYRRSDALDAPRVRALIIAGQERPA